MQMKSLGIMNSAAVLGREGDWAGRLTSMIRYIAGENFKPFL